MKRAAQEEANVTARNVLDLEQAVVDLKSRIAVVEHWQDTAQGQNGISVNGNVFSGQRKEAVPTPPPVTNTYTYTTDGTETVPNGGIYRTLEIHNTGLPDRTPVSVDCGEQVFPIQLVLSRVSDGTIYMDFWSVYGSATMTAGTITVRAILAPGQQG
jgi:hypothetical protein